MGLFGKMFDMNRDGRVDFAESMLELGLLNEILKEEERIKRSIEEDEESIDESIDEYIGNKYEYYDSIDEYAKDDEYEDCREEEDDEW